MLSKWPIRNKLLDRHRPAAGDRGHAVVERLSRRVCLSQPGAQSERPRRRIAAGCCTERASQRPARDHRPRFAAPAAATADGDPARRAGRRRRWQRQFADDVQTIRATLDEYRGRAWRTTTRRTRRSTTAAANGRRSTRSMRRLRAIAKAARTSRVGSTTPQSGHGPRRVGAFADLVRQLPSFLHERHPRLRSAKSADQYRTLIILTWITTISAASDVGPVHSLVLRLGLPAAAGAGQRLAARGAGEFGYRISLDTHDEMSELAEAMNDMTARFQDDSRRPRPPGAGADQAGGAQRAVGQRRLSGRRRGPRNQQSAGLDRHVRRVAGRPLPRAARRRADGDRRSARRSATTCA